jgi:hypothetical protein
MQGTSILISSKYLKVLLVIFISHHSGGRTKSWQHKEKETSPHHPQLLLDYNSKHKEIGAIEPASTHTSHQHTTPTYDRGQLAETTERNMESKRIHLLLLENLCHRGEPMDLMSPLKSSTRGMPERGQVGLGVRGGVGG